MSKKAQGVEGIMGVVEQVVRKNKQELSKVIVWVNTGEAQDIPLGSVEISISAVQSELEV